MYYMGMKQTSQHHHRQSIRLAEYDYRQAGFYFVTIVTAQRENIFGEIDSGIVQLNDAGYVAQNEWNRLTQRFAHIDIDKYVVMPNHFHGVLIITESEGTLTVGARQNEPFQSLNQFFASPLPPTHSKPAPLLGTVIGAYKSTTARIINALRRTPGNPVWQRNYYEHIIREPAELEQIRAYIMENPNNWENDAENNLASA